MKLFAAPASGPSAPAGSSQGTDGPPGSNDGDGKPKKPSIRPVPSSLPPPLTDETTYGRISGIVQDLISLHAQLSRGMNIPLAGSHCLYSALHPAEQARYAANLLRQEVPDVQYETTRAPAQSFPGPMIRAVFSPHDAVEFPPSDLSDESACTEAFFQSISHFYGFRGAGARSYRPQEWILIDQIPIPVATVAGVLDISLFEAATVIRDRRDFFLDAARRFLGAPDDTCFPDFIAEAAEELRTPEREALNTLLARQNAIKPG
jgi:hypothetical protein